MNYRSVLAPVLAPALASALALALLLAMPAVAGAAPGLSGDACHLPGYSQPLRCISVPVPLDYAKPDGQKIALHVTLAPAFREAARADPLFVLAGGPGQAGSDILPLLDNTFRRVRATRDIVFIDQRGTGRSGKLDCDSTRAIDSLPEAEQEAILAMCLKSLKAPFAAYTTDHAARDLEQVRLALAYRHINIWGASYGTRLGQAYARRFPESLRAMVLDGVAAPEQIIFAWGQDSQASLDAVFQRCADDRGCRSAFPDLRGQFASLLARAKAGQVSLDFRHPRTAIQTRLQLPPDAFLQTVRASLYSLQSGSRLPFIIDSAHRGNWAPFLVQMLAPGDFSIGGTAAGLMLAVTCAEDIPRLTPAIVAEEEKSSFLGGAEVKRFPAYCRYVNVPAVPYVAPTLIKTPTLLLSGALDPVTPPRRAVSAAASMSRSQHVVVANLGHGVSFFGCGARLLRQFLDAPEQTLDAACLHKIPAPGFQLGAAGPQP